MAFITSPHILRALLTVVLLVLCLRPGLVRGDENDETLDLYSGFQESSSSASRAPKPLSRTAENVTIITYKDIEALNAHSLADVLATLPGIQVDFLGGPGSVALTAIQGSVNFHVLVMVDGNPINTLGEGFTDVALVPARIIERIEIVKGAASSAWGQALGGVINVTTKTPDFRPVGGAVLASIGSSKTTDDSIELSGSSSGLGYYLYGGYLGSDGIVPHIDAHAQNAYGKLTYDLPGGGQAWGTFGYTHSRRTTLFQSGMMLGLTEGHSTTSINASLGLRTPLTSSLELEISGRHRHLADNTIDDFTSNGLIATQVTRDKTTGGAAKLIWRTPGNLLVTGIEYEHGEVDATRTFQRVDSLTPSIDRIAFFLNDTITLGNLTVIPGMRIDHSNFYGNQFSPALGLTYLLGNSTVLRLYTARGHSILSLLQQSNPPEKVWTAQIGIESGVIPFLWQKLTFFRSDFRNVLSRNALVHRIAVGGEYEIRTTPVFNTTFAAGYTFTDTRQTNSDAQVPGLPRHTVQLLLRYDDRILRGALTGRHIFWNSDPADNGRYQGMIWDLHLGATLLKRETSSLELFFSGHNLFNGSQSMTEFFPFPGRWFEGGMRVNF
jgi:vitamin B12 transporter